MIHHITRMTDQNIILDNIESPPFPKRAYVESFLPYDDMMITIWWYDDQPTNRRTSEDRATQPMQWKLEAEFRNIKHLSIFLNKTKSLRQGLKITIEIFHQDTFSIIKFQPCHLWNKVLCWNESLQYISFNIGRKWIKRNI